MVKDTKYLPKLIIREIQYHIRLILLQLKIWSKPYKLNLINLSHHSWDKKYKLPHYKDKISNV